MQTAPVSCRADTKRPPAATIALVPARWPLPMRPKTTSPPRRCSVRPIASETSIAAKTILRGVRAAAAWVLLGAAIATVAVALSAAGFPSATLFAALIVGLAWALARPQAGIQLPKLSFLSAQAVGGV